MKRHMQPADEPAMQQGCERARVHHQTGGFSIDGCVNVQIISFTYANRHTAEAAILCARRFARKSGIHFEDQYLFLQSRTAPVGKRISAPRIPSISCS